MSIFTFTYSQFAQPQHGAKAWGQKHGDLSNYLVHSSVGMEPWGWECGDRSMGILVII